MCINRTIERALSGKANLSDIELASLHDPIVNKMYKLKGNGMEILCSIIILLLAEKRNLVEHVIENG